MLFNLMGTDPDGWNPECGVTIKWNLGVGRTGEIAVHSDSYNSPKGRYRNPDNFRYRIYRLSATFVNRSECPALWGGNERTFGAKTRPICQ